MVYSLHQVLLFCMHSKLSFSLQGCFWGHGDMQNVHMWITLKHLLFKRNGVEAPFFNIPNILMNTEDLITHLFYVFN